MSDTRFTGTGVAIITPFNNDFSVDHPALERVVEHCIKGKVNYIVVLGTTGETATLSQSEKSDVINTVIKATAKRVPIVVGIGGNSTSEVVEGIKTTDLSKLDGVLSVVPYYNKPSQKGIYEHYKAIAQVSTLPVIIYNVPGRTVTNMNAETAVSLAHDFSNIVALKEASGNMQQIMEIMRDKPDSLSLISGEDALTFPMIALGAQGVISVVANSCPLDFSIMVEEALGGNYQLAKKIHYSMLEFIKALFAEGSPAGVKAAMHSQGLIQNVLRLPLTPVSDAHYQKLAELVKKSK
ncbi:MAG: 4-hydroxy-tetrahydrodipicolinate synthase [Bacteroidota bacterium]|nr:4-hydroxy-tetrahydrodipicolinate synthase [Bacteroidota bacterium]